MRMAGWDCSWLFKPTWLVGVILAWWVLPLQAQDPVFLTDSLDGWMVREMERWQVPGVAVSIIKDGRVVVEKGFGVRDLETGDPVDAHTLFMVASNSKIFAGTLLAALEAEGKLQMSDTVRRWLPWFELADPTVSGQVNITDLITHRLGLETFQGDLLHWANTMAPEEMVRRMRFLPQRRPFRAAYGYCNVGYVAAGLIMEAASGQDWHTLVRTRMFEPLGMTRASTRRAGIAGDGNAARPYTLDEGQLVRLDYPDIDAIGPAASINASARDMRQWLQMQLDSGRVAGREVFPWPVIRKTREAQTIIRTVSNPDFPSRHIQLYGLGWYLSDYSGTWVLDHGGGADGFVTTTAIVPELGLGIVVLTNTDVNGLYNALKQQVLDAYLGLPYRNYSALFFGNGAAQREREQARLAELDEEARSGAVAGLAVASVTGTFHHPHLGRMTVWEDDAGDLSLRLADHPALEARLRPLGGNRYQCQWSVPTYGRHAVHYEEGSDTWFIRVNDFVDREVYSFVRRF